MRWHLIKVPIVQAVLCVVAIACGLFVFVTNSPAQQTIPLAIVSPIDGTVVNPGQTVGVVVSTTPTSGITQVTLVGEQPLPLLTDPVSGPPFSLSLEIPSDIAPGKYRLYAYGVVSPGVGVSKSAPVALIVEVGKPAAGLKAKPSTIRFGFGGDQVQVEADASFADGSSIDVTHSTLTQYVSNSNTIAVVSPSGLITAVGEGNTDIVIRFGSQTADVAVAVPKIIPGDLNGDGNVDNDDLNILRDALNTPAVFPFDARDLNKDGRIDALDARLLINMCTRPRCATQ